MFQRRSFTGVVVLMILVLLVATGCAGSKAVAKVDGEKITRAELDKYTNVLRLFMPNLEAMLKDKKGQEALQGQILDAMIENKVIEMLAKEQNVSLTDKELTQAYEEQKSSFVAMSGSEKDFEAKMKELKIKDEDIKQFVAPSLLVDKMIQNIAKDLPEDEVAAYLGENPTKGVQLELSHILLKTEAEAQAVIDRLKAGEDFKELAAELSTDPSAETNKGYLDWVPADSPEFDADFLAGANKLKANEISEPVKTQFGYHVILLHDRKEPTVQEGRELVATEKLIQIFDEFYENLTVEKNL